MHILIQMLDEFECWEILDDLTLTCDCSEALLDAIRCCSIVWLGKPKAVKNLCVTFESMSLSTYAFFIQDFQMVLESVDQTD